MKWLQKKLINLIVKKLFNLIDEKDLFTMGRNGITFKGRTLEPEIAQQLMNDAKIFQNSELWKLLVNEAKYAAYMRTMYSTQSYELVGPKAVLFVIDVIDKKVKELSEV